MSNDRERMSDARPVRPAPMSKPGRNDPCPCGSGRKYKQCCARFGTVADTPASPLLSIQSPVAPSWFQQAMSELGAGRVHNAIALTLPYYSRNPNQNECAAFAEQLTSLVNGVCDDFTREVKPETAQRVQLLRLQLAETLAAQPPGSLAAGWNLLAHAHAKIMMCGLRDFVRGPIEEETFARFTSRLGAAAQPAAELLLAAALLARNFELPLVADFERLPDWVRPGYFTLLLESPQVFNQIGEAERYVDYLEQLTERVHAGCVRVAAGRAGPVMREFATLFATRGNFTQAYFSARNLRTLYQQRGEIISAFLFAQGIATLAGSLPPVADSGRKIRLGIFAHRFTPGTETYFTLSHFEHLDRERFDITLYALTFGEHALEKYCESRADRVVVLSSSDMSSQVQRIRADSLDLLLISTNMTTHTIASMLLGSVRLAPIQIASVSSPVTTGARHIDVMLSARWNEPEAAAQQHYTEHLQRLPGSINYYAYQHDHDPATVDLTRAKVGIPDDALVFFSGANFFKILPELSQTWVQILAAVPNSVLLLMPFNPNWGSNYQRLPLFARFQQQLQALGIEPSRLVVIDTVPARADVHRVMAMADVYLDAYPFAGACSMLDSIIAAVPAVVRRGSVGRSNHGASLLRMVGLEELSCETESQYIEKAIALANDSGERQRIRDHLKQLNCAGVPVYYDTRLFGSRVGTALTTLFEQRGAKYAQLNDPARLRQAVAELGQRLIGQRTELNALTDIGIVRLLVEPFFPTTAGVPRRMLDVGACHGVMAVPLLAKGWQAELLEPDPAAREVLLRNVAPYAAQANVHALAAGKDSLAAVEFHQATVQGLSGFSASPFGATSSVLQVPCVSLADFCAQREIGTLDFLKIDAEGYDFDVLESLDFGLVIPELVLVEYGTHFPRQSLPDVDAVIARMAQRGYGAVVFAYTDDGNFQRSVWVYRLTGLGIDRVPAEPIVAEGAAAGAPFGNILFFRGDNPRLLLILHALLESCADPLTRFTASGDTAAG